MTDDHEQIRREASMAADTAPGRPQRLAVACLALLAELKQAKRAIQVVRDNAATVEANLREQIELERAAYRQRDKDTKSYLARAEQAERELTQAHANIDQLLAQAKHEEGLREQAERELGEARSAHGAAIRLLSTAEAQLAAVPALVEFLKKRGHAERCASYRHDFKIRFRHADPLPCICGFDAILAEWEQAQRP